MAKRKKSKKSREETPGIVPGVDPRGREVEALDPEKIDKILSAATKSLKDRYDDTLQIMSDTYINITKVIPLGCPELEEVIGYPGWPMATIVEIRGRPSSGKSTLSKWVAAQGQKVGVLPIPIDTEASGVEQFDISIGLDTKQAIGAKSVTINEAFDKLDAGLTAAKRYQQPSLGIIDSLAIPTREQLDLGFDENGARGRKAAFLSDNVPKLKRHLDEDTAIILINQVRQNQDPRSWVKWLSPGGVALEHYCHMRIEMSGRGQIKEGKKVIGIWSHLKVIKSKISPPFKSVGLAIYFDPPRVVFAEQIAGDPEDG